MYSMYVIVEYFTVAMVKILTDGLYEAGVETFSIKWTEKLLVAELFHTLILLPASRLK